jgi:hypothetical protein
MLHRNNIEISDDEKDFHPVRANLACLSFFFSSLLHRPHALPLFSSHAIYFVGVSLCLSFGFFHSDSVSGPSSFVVCAYPPLSPSHATMPLSLSRNDAILTQNIDNESFVRMKRRTREHRETENAQGHVLSMSCLCLVYVLSVSCLCFVYAFPMSCLCLVCVLSVCLL